MKLKCDEYVETSRQIRSEDLMGHVRVLASDQMRGRMPGDSGYELACRYVEDFFLKTGLQPLGDHGTFRQAFHLETNRIISSEVSWIDGAGASQQLTIGEDYVCRGLSGGGDVLGDMVFCGYATQSDSLNEFDGVDVRDKIVVAFKYPAAWASQDAHENLPRARAQKLHRMGARALVLIPNPNLEKPDRLSASLMESGPYIPDFPLIVVSEPVALRLMSFGSESLASRQYKIDVFHQSASCTIPGRMSLKISTDWNARGTCWNIIGLLPGSDPLLKDEAVVVGAHLDHVGIQNESVIFNGAQDDASGVAAMMEIARVFSNGLRPLRSIVFVAFGAEEAGILGSKHYAAYPAWPLKKTRVMFNLDCMGAGNGLDTRGRKHYPELFEVFDRLNNDYFHIEDTKADHTAGGADAEPFHLAGVPNMFVVTRLPYQHLHMKSDLPRTLNPVLFESVTQLVCTVVLNMSSEN